MPAGNTARKIIIQQTSRSTGARRWIDWITPPPSRLPRWLLGVGMSGVGCFLTLIFFGLVIGLTQVNAVKQSLGFLGQGSVPFILVLVLFGPVLMMVFRYARRIRAQHALQALRRDVRAPLLLLRAFRDDYYRLPGYRTGLLGLPQGAITRTFEEYLYDKLSRCGPVIAIGWPGEGTPPLGALRFWVADDKWKMVVEELLTESQYVLMIMGNLNALRKSQQAPPPTWAPPTPRTNPPAWGRPPAAPVEDGLTWEVRRVFSLREIHKVILVMPPVDENEAFDRWEQYRLLSQYRLPPYQGGELAAVFAADGACWVVRSELKKGWFGKTGYLRDKPAYDKVLDVPKRRWWGTS